jgi:transposase
MNRDAFIGAYRDWCGQWHYRFNPDKAVSIYKTSQELAASLPKDAYTESQVKILANRVTELSGSVEIYRAEMQRLAKQLPEYPAVMRLFGVGKTLGPLLIAEIGDIRRFSRGRALVAFAGIDPGGNQSGKRDVKSVSISRSGSKRLRGTLYNTIICYVKIKPKDEPVYQFYLKKRAEGKEHFVAVVAAANKFLRIYYARVKVYLDGLDDGLEQAPA